eukprot:SAG25_NODE_112_length_14924_cov_13.606476_3_plen_82_part_00
MAIVTQCSLRTLWVSRRSVRKRMLAISQQAGGARVPVRRDQKGLTPRSVDCHVAGAGLFPLTEPALYGGSFLWTAALSNTE